MSLSREIPRETSREVADGRAREPTLRFAAHALFGRARCLFECGDILRARVVERWVTAADLGPAAYVTHSIANEGDLDQQADEEPAVRSTPTGLFQARVAGPLPRHRGQRCLGDL